MKLKLSDLWRIDGTIGRREYLFLGTLLFALKFAVDWFISERIFHRAWSPLDYIQTSRWLYSDRGNLPASFLPTVLAVSVPFAWAGFALTLRRARDAAVTPLVAIFFFVPFLKFLLFAGLLLIESRPGLSPPPLPASRMLDRLIPRSALGSAIVATLLSLVLAIVGTYLSTNVLKDYGFALFVGLPACMGFVASIIHGWHEPRSLGACFMVSFATLLVGACVLLGLAVEGVICLIMAAPLAIVMAMIGAGAGYFVQRQRWRRIEPSSALCIGLALAPFLMIVEDAAPLAAPVFKVVTSVDIDAPPERVWQHVITFPELPPPTDLVFKLGIAYPIRARIEGTGVGAVRKCEFSTGPFVEPITVWDEPRLLKFSVTHNPAPMAEWTPYRAIHPPHLDGFLASNGGQFHLIPLPGGRTRLEGTTWYLHHMQPAAYWQLFSDSLIHRIHLRVLRHVKTLAEAKPEPARI